MKQRINELMQKEMSRHEFLAVLGFGLVSILGFSSILKFVLENNSHSGQHGGPKVSQGYGVSPYGE